MQELQISGVLDGEQFLTQFCCSGTQVSTEKKGSSWADAPIDSFSEEKSAGTYTRVIGAIFDSRSPFASRPSCDEIQVHYSIILEPF